ncbi:ribosome maturation factor RimM [Arthrobacter sp. ISL-65]|uniref:ribosome maturation factor RimM n=1 Tax=Arthrobacter sp. ISL-65 TaxID=2819112 RepID=UPI001BE7430B|nr:ribosome maturation factor RimM [Arthrobacter sp. ISL-65]MBT2548001.1 ribosome maturation factor RimM [Arthrobacter sp. ISL-65]
MQLQVARIGKPHGIRGEVTVQVLTDAPEDRFVPGTEFVVEPASAGPLTVRSARWNKDILLLGFEEIQTRNEAETFRGAKLFIETEELDEDDDDEGWYEHELVGLEARVGTRVVGKITALNTMPVQDLLVVETTDGKEILIPFVEQIVPEVNTEGGYVLLTPPAGLFEINEEGAGDPETRGSDSAEEEAEPEANA